MQTPILENINDNDNQVIQEYDIQMYDLNAMGITPDNLTSVFADEAPDAPTCVANHKNPARHYFKWTYHEINQLHREAQIMDLTIQEIAKRHQRTNSSILFKLMEEKIIKWDGSLDNTNMRTVLQYYNNYLRHYHEIEDEGEEGEEDEDEEDEDYVPSSNYEEEEDDDEQENFPNAPLFQFNISKLNQFEKTLLTHGYPIYCAIIIATFTSYFLIVMSSFFKN